MFKLVKAAKDLLTTADFDWSICGGFAIDLFHGKETRKHVDIDVSVFWENRSDVIDYLNDLDWKVFEYCGNGISHLVHNADEQQYPNNNLYCITESNVSLHLTNLGNDLYRHTLDRIEQDQLDFIDFLFSRREGSYFVFERNPGITRELTKTYSLYNDISYLSPEVALLYKSIEDNREEYRHDFDVTVDMLDTERKTWLINSLKLLFPYGHKWIKLIQI